MRNYLTEIFVPYFLVPKLGRSIPNLAYKLLGGLVRIFIILSAEVFIFYSALAFVLLPIQKYGDVKYAIWLSSLGILMTLEENL